MDIDLCNLGGGMAMKSQVAYIKKSMWGLYIGLLKCQVVLTDWYNAYQKHGYERRWWNVIQEKRRMNYQLPLSMDLDDVIIMSLQD